MLRTLYLLTCLTAAILAGCSKPTPTPTAEEAATTPPLENPSAKSFRPSPPPP